MDFGYVIKFNDNQFNVFVDLNNYYSGYGVVPKTEDPDNLYDIEEVKAYCEGNPDKVLSKHPLEQQVLNEYEIESLKSYLSETDYAVIKCQELGLNLDTEYPGLLERRAQARAKINELESEYAELRMAKLAYPILE